MTARIQLGTFPAVPCVVLLGFGGLALDLPQEKPLLPLGRLTRPVEPGVSGLTRTPEGGDNLRCRESGKVGLEAHGRSIPGKEMSAMQKKELAKRPQCGHSVGMTNEIATTQVRHTIKETCTRCCGSGNTGHRRCGGVCFRCGGAGFLLSEVVLTLAKVEQPEEPKATPLSLEYLETLGDDWLLAVFGGK